jgi:hypothetical protein
MVPESRDRRRSERTYFIVVKITKEFGKYYSGAGELGMWGTGRVRNF